MVSTTKPVPGGCVLGLFGLVSWTYTGLCVMLLTKLDSVEDLSIRAKHYDTYFLHGVVSFLLGALLIYGGYRLTIRSRS